MGNALAMASWRLVRASRRSPGAATETPLVLEVVPIERPDVHFFSEMCLERELDGSTTIKSCVNHKGLREFST